MIDFFEFLNSCSPIRTIIYLVFIVIITFITLVGVSSITETILGRKGNQDIDETKAQD